MGQIFIKVTFASIWQNGKICFTSLNSDSAYGLNYEPGVWIVPRLKRSKLFIFQNVQGAFDFMNTLETPYRHPEGGLPFFGKVLWWCTARNVEMPKQLPLFGLMDEQIEQFWERYPVLPLSVPRVYRYRYGSSATLFADAVLLLNTVTEEEIARLVRVEAP